MLTDESRALRIYHETRCEQEKARMRRARCARSAVAHAHLFSLHRMRSIDLTYRDPDRLEDGGIGNPSP